MNFNRNWFKIIALVGATFAIAGCRDRNAFVEYKPISEVEDKHEDIIGPNESYIKYGDYKSFPASSLEGSNTKIDYLGSTYEVLTKYTGRHILEATGDRKILVVPVEFSDYTIKNLGVSSEEYVSNLEKAFFGDSVTNKYVSVAEYYNKASYGKLRITGKVCDKFYTFPRTRADIEAKKTPRDRVQECYDSVLKWYDDTYHESLEDYYIDSEHGNDEVALYLVYTLPTELNTLNSSFFWAYTFKDKPLSWSSYSVMNTLAGYPDAHTFIHEVGHLFGLEDYYPTDENDASNQAPEPAGRIDMMDCSVGDHTALSKMWLNWARPYWVKDTCEITIKALVDAGDLILINDSWNGTVFDEYYLIEFYSPTGLNYHDTNIGNNLAKLPTLPGVKIYHVDARLGYYDIEPSKTTFKHYCDEVSEPGQPNIAPDAVKKNINIVHNNSTSTDVKDADLYLKNYLYELELNHVGHSVSGCAKNYNLFRTNETFPYGDIEELSFNKLNTTDYKITVTGMTYRDATIKIEKTLKI